MLCLTTVGVMTTLHRRSPQKDVGPDSVHISSRVLRGWTDQLTHVLNDINSAVVPTCFKATAIVLQCPASRTTSRCIHTHNHKVLPDIRHKAYQDPAASSLHFMYHHNRSTNDSNTTTLHLALTLLDNKDTYAVHRL